MNIQPTHLYALSWTTTSLDIEVHGPVYKPMKIQPKHKVVVTWECRASVEIILSNRYENSHFGCVD